MVSLKNFFIGSLGLTLVLATPVITPTKSIPLRQKRQSLTRGTLADVVDVTAGLLEQITAWAPNVTDALGDASEQAAQISIINPSLNGTVNQIQSLLLELLPLPANTSAILTQINTLLGQCLPEPETVQPYDDITTTVPAATSTSSNGGTATSHVVPAINTGMVTCPGGITLLPGSICPPASPDANPLQPPEIQVHTAPPVVGTVPRQIAIPESVNCTTRAYSQTVIQSVLSTACNLWENFSYTGSFPHIFYNQEGINFGNPADKGTYGAFPLTSSAWNSTATAPGPDRIVFDEACSFLGVVTHTGASAYNRYILCELIE